MAIFRLHQALPVPPELVARRDLWRTLRWPALLCLATLVTFFGIFGVWATTAPLSSAAIAPGVVSPEGSRRTVQHLEGGIIQRFLVRDGDAVKAGDALVELDDTQPRATYVGLQAQAIRLSAMKMRIEALRRHNPSLDLASKFRDAMKDQDFAQFIANEMAIFATQKDSVDQQHNIYEQQIEQLKEEIKGYQAQISSSSSQLDFIDEELTDTKQLLSEGLARKPRILELERMRANLVGTRGQLTASVARAQQKIAETMLAQIDLENKFQNNQNDLLLKTNTDLAQIDERARAARDVLQRTKIRAPIAGIIVNLRFKTKEGVIRPGEPILDIVPTDDKLIVEARVSPNDIDVVKPGQSARVHLTPYHTRYTNYLQGSLREISADALTDEKTGAHYYRAFVVIDHEALTQLGQKIELTAGMPAEVFISTGDHTLLTYMIEPFSRSLRRSFREK